MNTKVYEETFSGFGLKYCFNHSGAEKYMYPYIRETNDQSYDIKAAEEYIDMHVPYYTENTDIRYVEYKSLINLTSLQLLQYHSCMIHAVAFAWKGNAWLMSGPSGTGKTTQYKNWKKAYKDDVQMICGDMPVLRVEDDHTITVHPSPWNGKERIKGHISAPLGGIIILEQSDIDEIAQMKKDESAIPLLLQLALKPETEQDVKNMSMIENVILDHYPVWKMKNRGDVNSVYLAAETFERMIMEAKRL